MESLFKVTIGLWFFFWGDGRYVVFSNKKILFSGGGGGVGGYIGEEVRE